VLITRHVSMPDGGELTTAWPTQFTRRHLLFCLTIGPLCASCAPTLERRRAACSLQRPRGDRRC
jgi:hypothetical protein